MVSSTSSLQSVIWYMLNSSSISMGSVSARYPVGDSPSTSSHSAASILSSISSIRLSSGISSCSSALYCHICCFISSHLTIQILILSSSSCLVIGCCPLASLWSSSSRMFVILVLALVYVSASLSLSDISMVG